MKHTGTGAAVIVDDALMSGIQFPPDENPLHSSSLENQGMEALVHPGLFRVSRPLMFTRAPAFLRNLPRGAIPVSPARANNSGPPVWASRPAVSRNTFPRDTPTRLIREIAR